MEEGRSSGRGNYRPTAEEVISKLKDDGDFDNLRLNIIRQIKDNEKLRNSIIEEVKRSEILNKDGSQILKPRQLNDALYQELGKKLMGQISDEIWKVIRNENTKADIRGTVESVYNRILNPVVKEDVHLPAKENGNEENGKSEPMMPPGFPPSDQQPDGWNMIKVKEEPRELSFSSEEHHGPILIDDDDMPPGFAPVAAAPSVNAHGSGGDLPPGFEKGGSGEPGGFATVIGNGNGYSSGGKGSDDPDLPPGFGG